MLPRLYKRGQLPLAVLIFFCSSTLIVTASRSTLRDGPINCYICDTKEECALNKGVARKCENNDAQTCMVIFDETGAVTKRGCSDEVAQTFSPYCLNNPDKCLSCESNGCNEATSLNDYVECIACDSADDENCLLNVDKVTSTKMCFGGCMTTYYPFGDPKENKYHLKRSCLNDYDLDDRTACENGKNNKCWSCNEAKCNKQDVTGERLKCYHCEDLECEDPESHECVALTEHDECYVLLDDVQDVSSMGCLSQYAAAEVNALKKSKKLYSCETDECNGYEFIVDPKICVSCSSSSSEDCATRPLNVLSESKCDTVAFNQCYERITSSKGVTERGCLYDLDEETFYKCLTEEDEHCRLCQGEYCNQNIFPEDRLKCHRCNSEANQFCEHNPASLSVCPVFKEKDSCVSFYQNGVTFRGCSSEVACDKSSPNCQECSGDGCNSINIKEISEELYGIFQDLPVNCYTCKGAECLSGLGKVRKCEGSLFQDCMTVFTTDGKVEQRGCSETVKADNLNHCHDHPELCFNCKANACNTIEDSSSYTQCLSCSPETNDKCLLEPSAVTSTRKCVEGCVSALHPHTANPKSFDFVRACFEDIELDDKKNCSPENNCVKCDSESCNKDILPAEGRLSCMHCNGQNCNQLASKPCSRYNAEDQCYMYFDNGTFSATKAGCLSDLLQDEVRSNIKQYFLCDGDDCNDYKNLPEAKICLSCSSADDENCASNPSQVQGLLRCQTHPYTDCVTLVNSQGHTIRGCSFNLATEDFLACNEGSPDLKCKICSESRCNGNIYPSDRLRCHRCDSSKDSKCAEAPDSSQACPLYKPDDRCVSKLINDITHRGCESEFDCSDSDSQNCRVCSGNDCNNINLLESDIGEPGLFQDLPLNCYTCREDQDCSNSLGKATKCLDDDKQLCTVAFAGNGSVIARGCSNSLDSLCSEGDNTCLSCKSNACNIATDLNDYVDCLFCDGQSTEECLSNPLKIQRSRKCLGHCMTALYPRTKDENPAFELIRSCLDDMDPDDQTACIAGNHPNCKSCNGEKCNTDDLGEHLSCLQCKGDCSLARSQTCHSVMENDQCFFEYDEEHSLIAMGCKSQYDPDELQLRIKAKLLWLCSGENCNDIQNIPVAQECALCSSRTAPNCAVSPNSVATKTKCSKSPVTQCYTRVLESGHTNRGCAADLNGDDYYDCVMGSENCTICSVENCNKEVYPAERLSCYVCDSATETICEAAPTDPEICLIHSADQQCVAKVTVNGTTVRGCSSKLACSADDEACEQCSKGNCNKGNLKRKTDGRPGLWQPLPLSCLVCTGESECNTATFSHECLTDKDYCMTVFNENGKVTKRGCSSGIESEFGPYCDLNSDRCLNCNSNGCNRAMGKNDYVECLYCDSRATRECVTNPKAISNTRLCHKQCMTALLPSANSSSYDLVRSCLDDKDEADQTKCKGEDCLACSGSKCNVANLPEDRLSCYHCEDCEEFEPEVCKDYRPDDKCYILFDDDLGIDKMGCLSGLEDDFINQHIMQLFVCEGNLCNDQGIIPQPQACAECNSDDDENCSVKPSQAPNVVQCNTIPNTQCYSRILSSGVTERGCVGKLSNNLARECIVGNSTTCSVCKGDRCNIDIFPADRPRCQRCNSKEDPDCSKSPNAVSVCPRFKADDGCSAKLVNGYTYRGCSSEFTCDDTDKQYCRNCISDSCNIADLESGVIGYPGKWEKPPISCKACEGMECAAGITTTESCDQNDLQNCVTVFAENGTVVRRGCSDSMYASEFGLYCDGHPEKCQFCKTNECNIAESLNDYVDCIFCDGSENKDCVLDVNKISSSRKCFKGCFSGFYPRLSEDNPAYELDRGCWDDLPKNDQENCGGAGKPHCKICLEDKCNTNDFIENRLKCLYCSGENCANTEEHTCTAYREDDKCFILYDGLEAIQMGCLSDLDNSRIKDSFRHLLTCEGDSCNRKDITPPIVQCQTCNSSTTAACAVKPENIGSTVQCKQHPYQECYVRITEEGGTIRGCLEDLPDENFHDCLSGSGSDCFRCNNDLCNNEIFPADRRKCLICDSGSDDDCESSPSEFSEICRVYSKDEKCVTKVEGSRLLRGCSSQLSCNTSEKGKCSICNGDNCNKVNLLQGNIGDPGQWQGLPLNCYKCVGASCENDLGKISKCEGNNKQTCMTVFNVEGAVERRDCSDSVLDDYEEYCLENPDHCVGCKSNACNTATKLEDFVDCYFCDSSDDPNCSIRYDSLKRSRKCQGSCMVALYPRSSSPNSSYELSRGCLDDMDLDDRQKCLNGDLNLCQACEGALCNNKAFPKDRWECHKCIDDCQDTEVQPCSSYHPEDECYILFDTKDGSAIAYGCRSEFEEDQTIELTKQKALFLCSDERGCNDPENIPEPKTCKICDSKTDPLCATNPNLVSETKVCRTTPFTDCYTRVDYQGITERGCLADLSESQFYQCLTNDTLCEPCGDDNCNALDVYPAGRRSCHQCSSSTDPNCESLPTSDKVCPIYKADDVCVTSLRNGVTYRGCGSSLKCDNEGDRKTCHTCKDSGCNVLDLMRIGLEGEPGIWQDVPLTCRTCKGDECLEGLGLYKECQGDLYQNCMTVFDAEGAVIQRGCSATVESENAAWCAANQDKCFRCNSNGCNVAKALSEYIDCLACDVKVNPNCALNVEGLSQVRKCRGKCLTAMYAREQETNPAFVLTRTCLDDLDLDDQEECEADKKDFCLPCSTEKCNSKAMPDKRLSCYHCSDETCDEPEAQLCPFYRPDDQCYIRFDETGKRISMGCRSVFSNADADEMLKRKYLLYCEGDNCNTVDSIPKPQECHLCNSRSDIKCAIQPDAIIGSTNCSSSPYTHCYSRVLSDGATERGCINSLNEDDFVKCLDPNSKFCTPCLGAHCNKGLYPENRLKCHICDSSKDASCETKPNSLSVCPKYAEHDSCVSAYIKGSTIRGCSSSVSCDPSNPKACSRCEGEGCNTINIARKQDDSFGKWQDLPLKCHVCKGNECSTSSKIETCQDNNEQDCMIVFDENGNVIQRGCTDAVEADHSSYCDEFPENCLVCKSNECNSASSKTNLVECIACDTHKDLNCLWNPLQGSFRKRLCDGGCMQALYPSDGSENPSYGLVRSCLNDKEPEDQAICQNGKDNFCQACSNAEGPCNYDIIPSDRHSCYVCQGDECEDPEIKVCPLYRENDQCFTWFDESNTISQMDCVSSLHNLSIESIIKSKKILVCSEKNCNKPEIPNAQKCAVCDSTSNRDCAVNAQKISNFNTCNNLPYTHCYSRLDKGNTIRGCVTDLNGDQFVDCVLGKDENCGVCLGEGCNREVFPEDRLQCYKCDTEEDEDCESDPFYHEPCPFVQDSETCITSLEGNHTYRGCSSSIFCDENDVLCRSCKATGCNAVDLRNKKEDPYTGYWQSLPLRCHTCEGEHCEYSLGPALKCTRNLNQDCMAVFNASGSVVRRGCSDDVEDYEYQFCRQNPHLCIKCKSNECNEVWDFEQFVTCTYCNSADDPLCITNPEKASFGNRTCNRECMVAMKDGEIIRSCLDDKELAAQSHCEANGLGENCARCDKQSCNTFNYPVDRLSCHTCTNAACSASEAQYCRNYDKEDYCFAKYENGRVDLIGCASSQNKTDLDAWKAQQKLYECKDKDCNDLARLPQEGVCLACDSSKTPECAQNPTKVTTTEQCSPMSSDCVVKVNSEGHTLRGCFSKLPQEEQDSCVADGSCSKCSGEKCNTNIFPENRRKCHRCNNKADDKDKCEKEPSFVEICPLYKKDDTCVSKRDKDGYALRGCGSELTCDGSYDICETCESDGCNTDKISFGVIHSASLVLTVLLAFVATFSFS